METMSLQKQFELPLVQDLIAENDKLRLTSNLQKGTKIPDSQIEKIKIPYVIENKLLMKAGEFNGVTYPEEEIQSKIEEANEKGLVYDHLDTQNQGVTAWVGRIENASWDETGTDGPGMYGDLVILDKPCAQKLAAGSKWGISPTIDYEKNEVDGKIIGTELLWKSFSFVLDPAVRDTMLNSKEVDTMENKKIAELELKVAELQNKKLPYKYPKADEEVKKKKKEDEKELMVDESTLKILEAKDAEIRELREFKTEIDAGKKEELVANLTANEFLIGRLSEDEIGDRAKTLMEKKTEVLSELADVVGNHAELSKYSAFVKAFMKKNKDATIAQAATAWKKGKGKLADEPVPDKDPAPGEEPAGEKDTQSLTGPSDPSKVTAELREGTNANDADREFYKHMVNAGGAR